MNDQKMDEDIAARGGTVDTEIKRTEFRRENVAYACGFIFGNTCSCDMLDLNPAAISFATSILFSISSFCHAITPSG